MATTQTPFSPPPDKKMPSRQLKSQRAYRAISDWIRDGHYQAGERLPSERDLAGMLGVNHLTVRRSLAKLEEKGKIFKKPNVGSFVAESTDVVPLALVLPAYLQGNQTGHPWTSLVTAGACSFLDPMRFSLSTLYYKRNTLWEDVGRALMNAKVRGVLLSADSSVSAEHVKRILDQGIKVVALQDVPALSSLTLVTVQPDHGMALTQVIHGLADRGHVRVRVGSHTFDPAKSVLRATLRTALEQTGIGSLEEVLLDLPNPPGSTLADTYRPMADVLAGDDPPTAIVVPDEYGVADLFQSCYRLGIRVPQDLSIAAVLDQTPNAYPVPLTAPDSVSVVRLAGKLAADQLVRLIGDGEVLQRQMFVHNPIVWRDSVVPIPASNSITQASLS